MEVPDRPTAGSVARGLALLAIVVLAASAISLTLAYEPQGLESGTVEKRANGTTLVAVQGFKFQGQDDGKKPARMVAADPDGRIEWTYNGTSRGANWFYDVDPLENGNVLAVNAQPSGTLVYELDPETKERVWEVHLDITDTHDVDLINGDQLLVANMREFEDGTSGDRLFVYDIGDDEIVWEWYFRNHYPHDTDKGIGDDDWTHVNDVDKVGPGEYLASPRNFDQVILVNRSTGEIDLQLGEDGDHSTLYEQHNPTYLETDEGEPTILVADSENDRVVEYTCGDRFANGSCDWELVWTVGEDQLNWPRDADRLPNGNTLIVDSRGHRVMEVAPNGTVVWEVYVPWMPYDAERTAYGDEGTGAGNRPTMRDMGVEGSYELEGSAGLTPGTEGGKRTFPDWLRAHFGGLPLVGSLATGVADTWQAVAIWVRPVWMAPWAMVHLVFAALIGLVWGIGEAIVHRDRLRRAVAGVGRRVREVGRQP